MCGRRAIAIAAILVGVVPSTGRAQSPAQPPAPPLDQRIEIAFLPGAVQPSVVALESQIETRSPPVVKDTGDSYDALTMSVGGRVWWTHHTSTLVDVGWTAEASRHYTFPRPASIPLSYPTYEAERTVSYRNRLIAIGQSLDLPSERLVPFVAAGWEFRSVTNRQDSVFANFTSGASAPSTTERSGSETALFLRPGVRVPLGRHGVASGDVTWYFGTSSDLRLGDIAFRWQFGAGVRF